MKKRWSLFNFTAFELDEQVQESAPLPHKQLRNCSRYLGHQSIQNNEYALSLSDWSKTEKAILFAM